MYNTSFDLLAMRENVLSSTGWARFSHYIIWINI